MPKLWTLKMILLRNNEMLNINSKNKVSQKFEILYFYYFIYCGSEDVIRTHDPSGMNRML